MSGVRRIWVVTVLLSAFVLNAPSTQPEKPVRVQALAVDHAQTLRISRSYWRNDPIETTTTIVQAPKRPTVRYNREEPIPVVTPTGCMRHGRKSLAESEACWGTLIAGPKDHPYTWDIARMFRIMDCESGGDPWDVNPYSGAGGLLQIHPAQPGSFDPATNIAQGYAKYLSNGYRPWVCT